jgi:hypothetical protein
LFEFARAFGKFASMSNTRKSADLNPRGFISHAQYAQERDLKPKTLNAMRRDYPALFPNAIQRGNKWYAERHEFDAFLDALRGTVSPGIAARASTSENGGA